MKIALVGAIDTPITVNSIGGTEMWTYNLAESLASNGIDITLFASSGSKISGNVINVVEKDEIRDSNNDLNKNKYAIYSVNQMLEVLKKEEEFDLIHVSVFAYYFILPVLQLFKKPVVVTIHGYNNIDFESAKKILAKYKNPHYVYVSNSFRNNWPKPINGSVIRNGIDLSKFDFNDTPKDYYLWIGRISEHKGIMDAINFAIKTENKLLIAGPIGNSQYYNQVVLPAINEHQNIEYLGILDSTQKVEYYGNARALIFTIQSAEPLPLVVLESFACGTPVLSYKIDPMPELIKENETGYLSDAKDIEGLIKNSEKLDSIDRNKCREFVEENFNLVKMTRKYIDLYNKLVN